MKIFGNWIQLNSTIYDTGQINNPGTELVFQCIFGRSRDSSLINSGGHVPGLHDPKIVLLLLFVSPGSLPIINPLVFRTLPSCCCNQLDKTGDCIWLFTVLSPVLSKSNDNNWQNMCLGFKGTHKISKCHSLTQKLFLIELCP
jgi:hypothetical protein